MSTARLFERYYFSRPAFATGTARFHQMIQLASDSSSRLLEIGCGPSNNTSRFLSGLGSSLTGMDIEEVANDAVSSFAVLEGASFPFPDCSFDICASRYVLEHITDPKTHFCEVNRVLRPGGFYFFCTPNLWHYVTLASWILPHSAHLLLVHWLQGAKHAHHPYPTVYRANTRTRLCRLASAASLTIMDLKMIESEPSYGAAHPLFFYPMMAYERIVNSTNRLSRFRVNILGVMQRPYST